MDKETIRLYKEKIRKGTYNSNDLKNNFNSGVLNPEEFIDDDEQIGIAWAKAYTSDEHISKIRDKKYSNKLLKILFKNTFIKSELKEILSNYLKPDEVIKNGFLTREEVDAVFYIPPEEHIRNITNGEYSDEEIKTLIISGMVDEYDLVHNGIKSQNEMDEIMLRPKAPFNIEDLGDWSKVPELKLDRVEVLVLGLVGSGKTTFMSGLIYYARKNGRLPMNDIDNHLGAQYVDRLCLAVKKGELPPATPAKAIQHLACDFTDDNSKDHPLTFLEMSGEIFEGIYNKKTSEKFEEYMFSPNNKIIFLAIDYKMKPETEYNVSQSARFEHIMQYFDKSGVLKNAEAVCLLITKWDESPDNSEEAASKFIKEEFLNLYRMCERYSKKYSFKLEIYRYSLGDFKANLSYTYKDHDSKFLFDWLCSFSPIIKSGKSKGLFQKFFQWLLALFS